MNATCPKRIAGLLSHKNKLNSDPSNGYLSKSSIEKHIPGED